ncbi:membrane protein [Mucilaginibacter gynuensis]|uniref:Membrane protein n=1 Tax=Mucilaginibacter gynuensis TaxID=1302236 RepID=A0ABP8GWW0_9SPHI
MIKYSKILITFLFAAVTFEASAQLSTNTSSPYSRYGIGEIAPQLLPQNAGMGGISTGINSISGYSTINLTNPAANAMIDLTTIDVGVYGNFVTLSQSGQTAQGSKNFSLNHLAFGLPVSKRSAIVFGLTPYSDVGYNYRQSQSNLGSGSSIDTNAVNFIYTGEGGLTKAYIGYGFGIGKHLSIGGNISYIFGNLKNYSSTEIPALYGTQNTRTEISQRIQGLNYDYGIQYMFDISEKNRLTIGYSGSANSKLDIETNKYTTHYTTDGTGNEIPATDTLTSVLGPKNQLQLPQINRFGISYRMGAKLLVGADYSMGKWSDFAIDGQKQGFKNSQTINVGAQITPNINKLNNYWALVDYRFGFMYNQTYLSLNNTDINQYAGTVGLGLPLRPGLSSFYKINISAEVGKRGSLTNGLVRESYVNIRLGFTLNDKWFRRYKFD